MSIIPTILYYWAIFLMVEFDAKKFGAKVVAFDRTYSLWQLTLRYGFHFTSLIAIVAIMVVGFTPIMAVFWSTVIAFAVSFIRPETAIFPKKLVSALRAGSIGVLSVAATCASAGIIVGVVTLTGLGLKFSSIVIDYAGGSLLLTAVFTAMVVWVIGLAVPVTASYIICAVIAAPALIKLGVPDYAAHMFIFYYSILSEVSPPTALSPFAAAALTGGDPYKTTMQAWKYTLPAFLVPFNFTLHPDGVALLAQGRSSQHILDLHHRTRGDLCAGGRNGRVDVQRDHLVRKDHPDRCRRGAGLSFSRLRRERPGACRRRRSFPEGPQEDGS